MRRFLIVAERAGASFSPTRQILQGALPQARLGAMGSTIGSAQGRWLPSSSGQLGSCQRNSWLVRRDVDGCSPRAAGELLRQLLHRRLHNAVLTPVMELPLPRTFLLLFTSILAPNLGSPRKECGVGRKTLRCYHAAGQCPSTHCEGLGSR